MSLGDVRRHVPWEQQRLLKGRGGRWRSHKLSFSLATEWWNARANLPPNFFSAPQLRRRYVTSRPKSTVSINKARGPR